MYTEGNLTRDGIVAKWTPLVHHVVVTRFPWVMRDTGTTAHTKIQRSVDYADAVQTGFIGLLNAIDSYSADARHSAAFTTYAYRLIYLTVLNYLEDNNSLLKTPRLSASKGKKQKSLDNIFNYFVFSDLDAIVNSHGEIEMEYIPMPPSDKTAPSVADLVEESEFARYCIEKLESHLTCDEYDILIQHYAGYPLDVIGAAAGLSKQNIQRKLEEVKIKCLHILYPERRLVKS